MDGEEKEKILFLLSCRINVFWMRMIISSTPTSSALFPFLKTSHEHEKTHPADTDIEVQTSRELFHFLLILFLDKLFFDRWRKKKKKEEDQQFR